MTTSVVVAGIDHPAIQTCTWLIYGVLCQLINLFGIATNIINIICFAKQGFQDSVNISLLGLAVSDLGSLVTMVWNCVSALPAVLAADLSFEPVEVMYLTSGISHFSFTRVSGCITAMITLERCLCITSPLKIKSLITKKRASLSTACVFIIFYFTSVPVYFVNKLGLTFYPYRNKTLVGRVSTSNRENVEMITFAVNNFCIPFCAFVIIVVCTTVLAITLHRKTKWRKSVASSKQEEDKVSNRNQNTAKMVVIISTLYIVCFVPASIIMLAVALVPEMAVHGKYMGVTFVIGGISYIMANINSSSNIFIYYRMSSNYRACFNKIFNIYTKC